MSNNLCVNCGEKEADHGWLCLDCAIKLGQVAEAYPEQPEASGEEAVQWWADEQEWDPEEEPQEVNLGDDPGGLKIYE